MDLPKNLFKQRLLAGERQIGLWCALSSAYAAEVVAGAGFDWLLFDTEHAPGGLETTLGQLQAVAPYPVAAVVRPAENDPVLIKKLLDIGAQTLLVPFVQTADEARAAVAAMRYAPEGIRGVAGTTRATRFGRVKGYIEGVDGVFIGPNDLAASLGHVGDMAHPVVVAAVENAIERLKIMGKPSGIYTAPDVARRCLALGATFTAVGGDIGVLARGADALAAQFRA